MRLMTNDPMSFGASIVERPLFKLLSKLLTLVWRVLKLLVIPLIALLKVAVFDEKPFEFDLIELRVV